MLHEGLGTIIETDEGRQLVATAGLVGIALYGPYVLLDPGRYVVAFQVSLLPNQRFDIDAVCAKIDVVSNLGKTTYAYNEFTIGKLRKSPATLTLSFDLPTQDEVEFRVHTTGETTLIVDERVPLVKISSHNSQTLGTLPKSRFPRQDDLPQPTLFVHMYNELRLLYERGVDFEIHADHFVMHYGGQSIEARDHNDIDDAFKFWDYGTWVDVSHAQMREDVTILRALKDVSRDQGFYIDVGANDPIEDSVTKLFYDRGWCGINVEPLTAYFDKLVRERPRDINIQAAVTDVSGEIEFFDIAGGQLSTNDAHFAAMHEKAGRTTRSYTVAALTLTEICDRHVTGDIHFLKIDVEGHEGAVLRGMDFRRFRPWILAVEATEPLNFAVMTHPDWETIVLDAGYRFVWMDLPNRYYVALEHEALAARFDGRPDHYLRMKHLL